MNHIRRTRIGSSCAVFNACHPERSQAESEAIRLTQSKDPMFAEGTSGRAGSFRVVVRFFSEQGPEQLPNASREAAAPESPARQCRVRTEMGTESRRDATISASTRKL